MKSKLKIMGKKLLVVVMSCLMLLGMTPVTKQAFTETYHNDVITDIKSILVVILSIVVSICIFVKLHLSCGSELTRQGISLP